MGGAFRMESFDPKLHNVAGVNCSRAQDVSGPLNADILYFQVVVCLFMMEVHSHGEVYWGH